MDTRALLFVLIFYLVFSVFLKTGEENYLLFLLCGKVPFLWFSKSVTIASNSIVENRGLIAQMDIPKYFFPYSSVRASLYKQWVVFLILILVVIWYGNYPKFTWLLLLPLILVQYGFVMLCSLIGAVCVSFVSDFRMLISMGMLFLMFISGVFWDIHRITDESIREALIISNPMAFFLDAYRQILLENTTYDITHLFILGVTVFISIVLFHALTNRISRRIAEKVIGL